MIEIIKPGSYSDRYANDPAMKAVVDVEHTLAQHRNWSEQSRGRVASDFMNEYNSAEPDEAVLSDLNCSWQLSDANAKTWNDAFELVNNLRHQLDELRLDKQPDNKPGVVRGEGCA